MHQGPRPRGGADLLLLAAAFGYRLSPVAPLPSPDADIRHLVEAGDAPRAATLALRAYGPEVLGFLVGMLRNEADASDVFAAFSERLWKGLPRFAWGCSLRTWCYVLARNEAHRFARGELQRRGRNVAIEAAEDIAERVRTETLPFLRTAVRDAVDELRATLSPDDRALLILRVDRELAWEDVALALKGGELTPADLRRETARLRKRFQLVKERILGLAKAKGIGQPE